MTTPSATMLIVSGKHSFSFDIFKDFIVIYSFLFFLLKPFFLFHLFLQAHWLILLPYTSNRFKMKFLIIAEISAFVFIPLFLVSANSTTCQDSTESQVKKSTTHQGEWLMLTSQFLHKFQLYQGVFNCVQYVYELWNIWSIKPIPNWHEHKIIKTNDKVKYQCRPSPPHCAFCQRVYVHYC